MRFDSVQMGAADLEDAVRQYRLLLDVAGESIDGGHRFALGRGAIEVVRAEPGLRCLRFVPDGEGESAPWPTLPDAYHGLTVHLGGAREAREVATSNAAPHAIDHVVVQSPDLDRAIALWRDRLGVRLALDREFPQRGLRLLFFRSGGVTLEFSGALGTAPGGGPDALWGIAYQVADLVACRARLLDVGVKVSEIRGGQKRGTVVATLKSHDLGVPTLLLQPVANSG